MTGSTDGSVVAVMRCADAPVPYVASVTVTCTGCGADCWLSARTGAGTIAMAARYGDAAILCSQCLREKARQGLTLQVAVTRDVLNEVRGAGN